MVICKCRFKLAMALYVNCIIVRVSAMRKLDFFFKYTIVNGIIILLIYFLYIVLIKLFSVTYLVSNIISYMIVVIVAYFFNRKFVFQTVSGGERVFGIYIDETFTGVHQRFNAMVIR